MSMDEKPSPEFWFVMNWDTERILEVCHSYEDASQAHDRLQPAQPLFPVVTIVAENEVGAQTFLRAWKMATFFPLQRLDPSTALLRTYIQAWQQSDTARLQMILQQAKTHPALERIIRCWHAEHDDV